MTSRAIGAAYDRVHFIKLTGFSFLIIIEITNCEKLGD
jgi:hypothetical protein